MTTLLIKNALIRSLGVLVAGDKEAPPFRDERFLRRLSLQGARNRIQIYVFTPQNVDWSSGHTVAYRYSKANGWNRTWILLPSLIYDRYFARHADDKRAYLHHLAALNRSGQIRIINPNLGGKWNVYSSLLHFPALREYLPLTRPLRKTSTLMSWLKDRQEAIIKPTNSSHGRGVVHIRRLDKQAGPQIVVQGRSLRNEPFHMIFVSIHAWERWLHSFIHGRKFLIQRFLNLTTTEGHPFDVRVLMQKNGKGRWSLTGTAARLGQNNGLTANLHGGGKAYDVSTILTKQFGNEKSKKILQRIEQLAHDIPPSLEQMHGRLAELGIDFGVDRHGRIWILEVNSKPGRSSFESLQQKGSMIASVENPILYAGYLLDQQLGGHLK